MPLQKSYSERMGLAKNRTPWQRSHSHPAPLQTLKTTAPLPISETTKRKLSKFQYQPRADEPAGEEDASGVGTTTPLTRLDWQDLVEPSAPADDEADTSPNDKIMWINKQDSSYSALSPMVTRKRKRARSSSPMSSPAADKPDTPAVNVEKLTKALKSPHADPTVELWDRYSLNGPSTETPAGAANPTLAQLMMSSSPRASKDASARCGERNLRRVVSCGQTWRRKIEKLKLGSQGSGGQQRDLEAASKSSLVTALLDTVTDCFQQGGSAPNQGRGEADETLSSQERQPYPKNASSPCPGAAPSSSDYGDDDVDDDTFMELEESLNVAREAQVPAPTNHTEKEPPAADEFEGLDDGIFDGADGLLNNTLAPVRKRDPLTTTPKTKQSAAQTSPDDEFEDDFDGDIDFDAVELAATQSLQQLDAPPETSSQRQPSQKPKTIQRYMVKSVLEGDYADQYGHTRPEKILIIQVDGSKTVRTVHLRGAWFDTPAHAESYVHVIGEFSAKGQCVIDDAQNLLILHPDQLISATVVADSFGCLRRAVLQDRIKATSESAPPLVYGIMLHEIFQEALLANQWDLAFLARLIERTTVKHMEDLYTIKVGMAAAREHLQSKMTELSHWAKAFVSSRPQADALVEDRNGRKANMAITKLLDVEEHVWSPMYGLKGNIDATVEVAMVDGGQSRTLTVPLELKTGRQASSSHMAQTALYTLLLSDRYDIDVACGILYYMETSRTMRIPAVQHELRHMIMQRNQLACHVRERSVRLPPVLRNKHTCGRCYAKTACFVYHRLADGGDGETSGVGDKFDEVVGHLTPAHRDFFLHWEELLTKEEKEGHKTRRELWTMTSAEREKRSRCFADVVIEEGSASVDEHTPRINRFHYTFVKRQPRPGFSFLESELGMGEPVVVSDEEGHFALAIGYVTSVRKQRISVAVDRRLHNARIRQPGFDGADKQVFAGIMEVARAAGDREQQPQQPMRYRLDQDEFSNGMATVRNNLVQLMANEVPAAARLRRLIVDLAAPRFKAAPTQQQDAAAGGGGGGGGLDGGGGLLGGGGLDGDGLNGDQRRAIDKAMRARDYALVLGMPGTGKTTTIAHLIRALTAQGKSVLLTSHTHTAVDNILLKLRADGIPVLRLGAPAKVHPEVRAFARLAGQPRATLAETDEAWHGSPVVATTCLGINHAVFRERAFDCCIVDEASQITLPICAGPIRLAASFVLVGDHNQLPPVVRNDAAREGGLDVSLFKLLSDAHPEAVVSLEHQYRMCDDIMALSNTLIYGGRLRCGFDALRSRKLHVPSIAALARLHHDASTLRAAPPPPSQSLCAGPAPSRCWLYDLVDGEARVRFVNTDTMRPPAREETHGKRIVNSAEVRVVAQLVEALLAAGVPASEVGVMTHYRAQLFLLKDRLRAHGGAVEMHTTDRFQGRDKDVVVLSLVRSNDACNIGDLLKDWRRINVAFTRAKTKLLVVGSMRTLRGSGSENMLSRFVALMEDRDWVYNLPPAALDSHHIEEPLCTPLAAASSSKAASPNKAKSPRRAAAAGKENRRPSPPKARIGERALLRGKPITRDILHELTNGAYAGI